MEIIYYRYNNSNIVSRMAQRKTWYYELTFCLSGELDYEINSKRYPLKKGDVVYIPPESLIKRENASASYVSFNFIETDGLNLPTLHNGVTPTVRNLLNIFDEFYVNAKKYSIGLSDVKLTEALKLIILQLEEQVRLRNKNPIVTQICDYIDENLSNNVTLADIVGVVHYSTMYCEKVFKQQTGTSIWDYLLTKRIEEAKRLFQEEKDNVNTVAKKVGFENANYFSRIFKKKTGLTPLDYVKKYSSYNSLL